MRYLLGKRCSLSQLALGLLLILPNVPFAAEVDYRQYRQTYLDARDALKSRNIETYKTLRAKLNGYPLAIYLDFNAGLDDILRMKGKDALAAIKPFETSPLYDMARHRYLLKAGDEQRWKDYLAMSPELPRATDLQCYFYRAQLGAGDKQIAWQGAKTLWQVGHSQSHKCDPLFTAWTKAGQRTQELVWTRMLASFDEGQTSLLSFLAQKATQNKAQAQKLLEVYQDPRVLRRIRDYSQPPAAYGDIVAAGLKRLARKDLPLAASLYAKYQEAGRFSDVEGRKLSRFIVWYALLQREDGLRDLVDTMLPLLKSDDLTQRRIRWALAEKDDATVRKMLALLNPETADDSRWRYWQHRLGMSDDVVYAKEAEKRNFYGFVIAEELKVPLSLAHQDTQKQDNLQARLPDDPALARISELMAMDKLFDAKSEWNLLMQRHNAQMKGQYGLYALEHGWLTLAVDASIAAELWDDMEMRFPNAEPEIFTNASKQFSSQINELRAISRRESAFYPLATSGVGARGLMQLMPGTAEHTAKQFKLKYQGIESLYQPEINIPLGSAYYSSLMKQFDGNRVLAVAAYNAGPGRVKQWLKSSNGSMDVMTFIETIPFTETRDYVQAVFTYRTIYDQRQQLSLPFFTDAEKQFRY